MATPEVKPADAAVPTATNPAVSQTPAAQNRPAESKAEEAKAAEAAKRSKGKPTSDDARAKPGDRVLYVWPGPASRGAFRPAEVVSVHSAADNTANLCVTLEPGDVYGSTHLFEPGKRFDPRKSLGTWHYPADDNA